MITTIEIELSLEDETKAAEAFEVIADWVHEVFDFASPSVSASVSWEDQ
jgi:hypothetical protein